MKGVAVAVAVAEQVNASSTQPWRPFPCQTVCLASPLHLQPAYAQLGLSRGSFPVSERAAERILAGQVRGRIVVDVNSGQRA